jgi:hypothetical protein
VQRCLGHCSECTLHTLLVVWWQVLLLLLLLLAGWLAGHWRFELH